MTREEISTRLGVLSRICGFGGRRLGFRFLGAPLRSSVGRGFSFYRDRVPDGLRLRRRGDAYWDGFSEFDFGFDLDRIEIAIWLAMGIIVFVTD